MKIPREEAEARLEQLRRRMDEAMVRGVDGEPLRFNRLSWDAGTLAHELRARWAEAERKRKAKQLEVRDALMEADPELARTNADKEARRDPRYLDYLEAMNALDKCAGMAELIRDVSLQRARILLWIAGDTTGADPAHAPLPEDWE